MKNLFLSIASALFAIMLFSLLGFSKKSELSINLDVPIGSIVAWPGPQATLPNGWLLCNGDKISKNRYPELCQVILDYWGPITGVNNDIHKLPDLQGIFLRGANNRRADNYADVDKENRTPSGNGASNEVGSFQMDEFKSHTHGLGDGQQILSRASTTLTAPGGGNFGYSDIKIKNSGGSETRPKNVYINYIIRAE